MDTSKEYIKMNEKATEIQDILTKECDSYYEKHEYNYPHTPVVIFEAYKDCSICGKKFLENKYCPDCGNLAIPTKDSSILYGGMSLDSRKNKRYIFLPRQDQLQKMVPQNDSDNYDWDIQLSKLKSFTTEFFEGGDRLPEHCWNYKTWEQLWLAFVMHEKYNKVWNGSDWVKE